MFTYHGTYSTFILSHSVLDDLSIYLMINIIKEKDNSSSNEYFVLDCVGAFVL